MLWLFVNEMIDNDEKLEQMCDKCKGEVTSNNSCIRCGTHIGGKNDSDGFINPNFDKERFLSLLNGTDDVKCGDIDRDIVNKIMD